MRVGGRRVRTIDIHAHVIIPEAAGLMGVKTEPDNASVIAPDLARERFARMDEWGTDMQVLSINANWYGVDQDVAEKIPARVPAHDHNRPGENSRYPSTTTA